MIRSSEPAASAFAPAPGSPQEIADQRALEHDAQHVADELPEPPLSRRGRRIRRWTKWAIALVVILFVGRELWQRLAEASAQQVAFRWPWALLASLTLVGLYLSLMASERSLLRAFSGVTLSWRQMTAVAWVPLAGKYVPGKVAAVAGAVVLLRRAGIATATGLSIFVILDAMPILTGSLLTGLLLVDHDVRRIVDQRLPIAWGAFAAVIVTGLICIHPSVFGRLMNAALRLLRRPPLPHVPHLGDYLGPALWSLGQWASNAGAIFFMCVAFSPGGQAPGLAEVPTVIGITALVMCVSYFSAFLTPSGIGVREAILLPLLGTVIPAPAAAAVTVAMRLAHTLVEIILCLLGLLAMPHLDRVAGRN